MCVDFYTLERREFGQAKRARTLRERTALTKPTETLAFRVESEAPTTPHQSSLYYRTDSFLTPTPKMQAFPGTPFALTRSGKILRILPVFVMFVRSHLAPRFARHSQTSKV